MSRTRNARKTVSTDVATSKASRRATPAEPKMPLTGRKAKQPSTTITTRSVTRQKGKVEKGPAISSSSEPPKELDKSEGELVVLDQDQVQGPPTGVDPTLHLTEEWYNNPLIVNRLRDWHREIASLRRTVHSVSITSFWPKVQAFVRTIASRQFPNRVGWRTLNAENKAMMQTWTPEAKEYLDRNPKVMLEAWLWRILVEDVFEGPGGPGWEPYSELLHKIQHWREVMARRIKGRAMLWRCLTMKLMGALSDTNSRYTVDYVTRLVTRKLGRWMKPRSNAGKNSLQADLQHLAEFTIQMDWHLHCNHQMFEFRFHDPTSKKAHGFPYKESPTMKLHITELDGRDKQGHLVNLIVQPSLSVWGDPSRPVEEWGSLWSRNISNMNMTVDMSL
ncbi:uncharacterized protein B0H64DRAFT_376010 [Chaetomium fimeti]|uniref:Uncharacterized protein n=1 Tax=Chaetomium fimeti TaxID=1854472 RepID=A0AAE0HB13_9PEZI|nr:hypothetical protein B0H64DRAFT_376010 [Chaetomium fimeti]